MFHADDPEEDENTVFEDFFRLMLSDIWYTHQKLPIRIIISEATWTKHHAVLSKFMRTKTSGHVGVTVCTISNALNPTKNLFD